MKKLIRDTAIVVLLTYVLYFGFIFSDRKASELAITLLCLFFFIAFVVCQALCVWVTIVCVALSALSFTIGINSLSTQLGIKGLAFAWSFLFLFPTIFFPAFLQLIIKNKSRNGRKIEIALFRFPIPTKWAILTLITEFILIVLPLTIYVRY